MNENRMELVGKLFSIPSNWRNVLYVHTPFCVQKCYYCVYSSKEPDDPREMDRFYNEVLPGQMERYRRVMESVSFDQVYFGGGTPTIADAARLETIYGRIPGFRDIGIKVTEASPYTVTDEHIELFGRYGFDYVSLGVQTLSARVLEAQNRKVVGAEKLEPVCRDLDGRGIISNIDLIFYLDTGGLEDLELTRSDLEVVMEEIRPMSITLHSNYLKDKSIKKQEGMVGLIREMLVRYPEYRCVNALLEDGDIAGDMKDAAEYRLMRDRFDFHFYMSPKVPQSHAYGHNMLALGAYGKFKPKYNYYYIFDTADKYAFKALIKKYRAIADDFAAVRKRLNLPSDKYAAADDFFKNEEGRAQFKQMVKAARLPFFEI